MKTITLTFILSLAVFFVSSFDSFGQFEQKYTLQASGGIVKPMGEFGDFFNSGLSLDAGVQYNFNRSLSFVGLVKFATLHPKENILGDITFQSIGISFCPKYRFMPQKKINPYVLGGIGLSFSSLHLEIGGQVIDEDYPTSFGITIGAGLDYSISDNFALFFQSGYNSYSLNNGGFNDKVTSLFFQLGLNISFLKSKSL